MRLEDRVAIVTAVGKQNGMGRGIARVLAGEGADLVLNSASEASVQGAVEEIQSMGRRAVGVAGDAASRATCEQLVEAAVGELGRLDILVCNAGVNTSCAFEETSEEAARRCVDVNFFGTFNLCQAALPAMKERGGSIVMITSVHAESAYPNSSIYNFTKAGLNHFSSTLGIELARYGIRVNALEPGWVQTPGSTGEFTDEQLEDMARTLIPAGRLGQAEDIGRAVAFLASDDADYVTSAMLRVDGGLIAAERKKLD
jgi:glucose 1-dehydrogenase